jgi:hypothetical protein
MKHKYCVIRKVPYRLPGTSRIVWANVLSESNGLSLLLVPKSQTDGAHSIVVAQENLPERVFESVGSPTFEIGSMQVKTIGDKLKILGMELVTEEFRRALNLEDFDL